MRGGLVGIGLGLSVLAAVQQLPAQTVVLPPGRHVLDQFGEGWFAELFSLPDGDSLWVGLSVRVSYAALLFEQRAERSGFAAPVQLSVVFLDTVEIVRRRLELRDTVWVREYKATLVRDSAWVRAVAVRVPKQVVRCRLQLSLGQRELRQQELSIGGTSGVPQWTAPLVASADDTLLVPWVFGSAIPFGHTSVRLLLWDSRIRLGRPYTYRFCQLPPVEGEWWWDSVPEVVGQVWAARCGRLSLVERLTGMPAYRLEPDSLCGWVEVVLPTAAAVPGRYELQLIRADTIPADTLRWSVRVVWPTMPMALRRIPYAVQSMRYLLTDEQWKQLRRGTAQEQWNKLWRYWKQRDPTPATAYNEAMAVYFRRVDHASLAFRSIAEPDGAQTERGKIYILYGEPTRVERLFPPEGAPQELWVYERFRKRFLFELRSDGRWYLVTVEG